MNPLKKENLLKTTGNKRALSQKKTTSELYFKYIYFKACVLNFFHFSPNDSPSKTIKNVFISYKKLFVLEIFKFLDFRLFHFFSLSTIALEVDQRKILKFMMSSTV